MASKFIRVALPVAALLSAVLAAEPQVVHMKMHSKQSNALVKRKVIPAEIWDDYPGQGNKFYYVQVEVGTPPVTLNLDIDTGSSDTWFVTPLLCKQSPAMDGCESGNVYDPVNSSSAAVIPDGSFYISYVDNSELSGQYWNDTLEIGSATLENFTLAAPDCVSSVTMTTGILGLGFDSARMSLTPYWTLPDQLVLQGYTKSRAFSIWMDQLDGTTGNILFGGHDRTRYHGTLQSLSLLPDPYTGNINRFLVPLRSITFSSDKSTSNDESFNAAFRHDLSNVNYTPLAAALDTGSTVAELPEEVFFSLTYSLNASEIAVYGSRSLWMFECSAVSPLATLDFIFGPEEDNEIVISVPFSEFKLTILELAVAAGECRDDKCCIMDELCCNTTTGQCDDVSDVTEMCLLYAQPQLNNEFIILGDTFLRSAYVTYDLDRKTCSLAQANHDMDDGSENIEEIHPPSA